VIGGGFLKRKLRKHHLGLVVSVTNYAQKKHKQRQKARVIKKKKQVVEKYLTQLSKSSPRRIPTQVRREAFARDNGRCAICGSTVDLQYDHIVPYAKGGSSLTEENVQLLCRSCNAKKKAKII
jgi:5-methylcytosine-specific restriction endonuclease McrA